VVLIAVAALAIVSVTHLIGCHHADTGIREYGSTPYVGMAQPSQSPKLGGTNFFLRAKISHQTFTP
jgi:hypothetical protein